MQMTKRSPMRPLMISAAPEGYQPEMNAPSALGLAAVETHSITVTVSTLLKHWKKERVSMMRLAALVRKALEDDEELARLSFEANAGAFSARYFNRM